MLVGYISIENTLVFSINDKDDASLLDIMVTQVFVDVMGGLPDWSLGSSLLLEALKSLLFLVLLFVHDLSDVFKTSKSQIVIRD